MHNNSLRPMILSWVEVLAFLLPLGLLSGVSTADDTTESDPSILTIDRIYADEEFDVEPYSGRWIEGTNAFTTLEPSPEYEGSRDIVRHDAETGDTVIMVSAAELIPPGESSPLKIDDYAWSSDQAFLLVYTNSQRVWRRNTRGDYWLLDRTGRQLRQLGGEGRPASMMFAELSPTGQHVAFVRDRNIYIEDLFDQSVRCLTTSESDDIINGTTDWAYEEEFGLREGFCWSPDGTKIAYWQINTEEVGEFPLVNNTDSLYPEVFWFAYPKVGQRNPSCRIGVVDCDSSETVWIAVPGEPQDYYIPRMEWADNSEELLIQTIESSAESQPVVPGACRQRRGYGRSDGTG